MTGRNFKVLAATDGSPAARAALQTALRFPWPEPSAAQVLVACRNVEGTSGLDLFEEIWQQAAQHEADYARKALAARWPDATLMTPDELPVDAVLKEARRGKADVIVLGWRGHGSCERLLAGSVSRAIVRRSASPVLVAREAPRSVKRIVLGYDGSSQARRAIQLLARVPPPRGNQVLLISVVEFLRTIDVSWLPASIRASLKEQAERLNARKLAEARKKLESAAYALVAAGWRVTTTAIDGAPLEVLVRACGEHRADVLVVGARAKRGVERALLGSVANGALDRCRIPVLVVP